MNEKNKHLTKALGISILTTIFVYLNMDRATPNIAIYSLVIFILSFSSIYWISTITAKAYQSFVNDHDK